MHALDKKPLYYSHIIRSTYNHTSFVIYINRLFITFSSSYSNTKAPAFAYLKFIIPSFFIVNTRLLEKPMSTKF